MQSPSSPAAPPVYADSSDEQMASSFGDEGCEEDRWNALNRSAEQRLFTLESVIARVRETCTGTLAHVERSAEMQSVTAPHMRSAIEAHNV